MAKRQSKRAKADRRSGLAAGLLIAGTIAVLVAAALYPRTPQLTPNLCPSTGPTGHIVLLVDATDPLSFTQRKAVEQLIARMTDTTRVPPGSMLTVFGFGDNVSQSAEPLFERCSPGTGSDKSELTDNLRMWRDRFDKEFVTPLHEQLPQMEAKRPATHSPILQMIQLAGLRFEMAQAKGEKRLIVVSDLLHNMPDLSLYRDQIDYEVFRRRPQAQKLRSELRGAAVEINLLMNSPQLQGRKLVKFWEDFFSDMGARVTHVNVLPG